jgi:uncharacterized protein involved in outer membrane biogenesis
VSAAKATGTVALGTLKSGRIEATDVRARATLQGGVLVLDELQAAVLGGRMDGAGTRVDLGAAEPTWHLAAKLSGVDLAKATQAFQAGAPVAGALDGQLDVQGAGTSWEKIRPMVTGLASLAVKDGTLTTADLGAPIRQSVANALQAVGQGGAAQKVTTAGGKTSLRDLAGKFEVKDGFLGATSPISAQTPVGKVALGGRLGLDGRLDLQGTAKVPRAALSGVAPAAVAAALPAELDVPVRIGGTLQSPSVGADAGQAVASAASAKAKQAAGQVRQQAERAGRRALGDALKGLVPGNGK